MAKDTSRSEHMKPQEPSGSATHPNTGLLGSPLLTGLISLQASQPAEQGKSTAGREVGETMVASHCNLGLFRLG